MDNIWERLEQYLVVTVTAMREGLAPGGTQAEMAAFETSVGYHLPEDVRQSLLRHNGQLLVNGNPIGGTLVPDGFHLLSLAGMLAEWQEHRAVSKDLGDERDPEVANPGIQPFFLHAAWIPIAADIGGNSICVDLDPGVGGIIGQIIKFDHEADTPEFVASDYRSWLTKIADGLEAGAYVYDHDTSFPGFFAPEDESV